jgi:hypothetical protein
LDKVADRTAASDSIALQADRYLAAAQALIDRC